MLRGLNTTWLTALIGGLALLGCEDVAVDSGAAVCAGDEDCPSDQRCAFDHCTVDGDNALRVGARILPPPGTGLLAQQVASVPLNEGPDLRIDLLEPVVLYGVISHAGDAFVTNIPGVLEARAPGDLPGMDHRFTTRSLEGLDRNDRGYELALLPGRSYAMTFRPDSRTMPSHTFTLKAEALESGRHDIELPDPSEYVSLAGFVGWSPPDPEPIGGARVGVTLPDGRVLPTLTTDPEEGRFETRLPPGTEEVRLRVEAPEGGPIFPDWETDWVSAREGVEVTVPRLPASLQDLDATVRVLTPSRDPAPGLDLALLGKLEGGTLRRSATTDADGFAHFQALPGAWEVLVSVPPGPSFATARSLEDFDADSDNTITLEPRFRVVGVVRDAQGDPVSGGTVTATRRPEEDPAHSLISAPAPFQAAIRADGAYELRVDPGRYDLRVAPPLSAGAPAQTVLDQPVEEDVILNFQLGLPDLAHLTIAAPEGAFLPDVTVELYALDEKGSASGPPLLTRGTTGAEGFVDLLVPFVR